MKKHHLKYLFDLFMTIIFLLLMDYATTGLLLHEIIGLGILAMFLFHKLINLKWIKAVGARLFSRDLKTKPRVMFLLDFALLLDVILIGISGVLVSVELFPWIVLEDRLTWVTIHHISAYAGLIMISVHIGLHWKAILGAFRKMLKIRSAGKLRSIITRSIAVLIMLAGIQASFNNDIVAALSDSCDGSGNGNGNENETISDDTPLADSVNASAADTESTSVTTLDTEASTTETESYDLAGQHRHGSGEEKIDEETHSDDEDDTSYEDDEDTSSDSSWNDSSDGTPSLNQYLSSLTCTACHKHCPLSNPKCIKGERQAEEATEDYYELYASVETDNEDGTTTSGSDTTASGDDDTGFDISDLADNVFADYLPVMGLFIGGTYYTIEILTKSKH